MKIGLFDIYSKYHNLALMKLFAYHKQKGDEVEFYNPLWHSTYDTIYCSKIFRGNHKNDGYIKKNMICGGSGFEYLTVLPDYIEHIMPDYSLYDLDYSIGFTTRGCIRNCKFCIVREKEGNTREHAEVEEFLNPKSNVVVLLDNNFLALPSHIKKLQKYIKKGWVMDFNQGLDLRLVNKENAKILAETKHRSRIKFAWDSILDESKIIKGLKLMVKAGVGPGDITVYVLVGYDSTFEEDLYRVNILRGIKDKKHSIKPYIMNYNNTLKSQEFINFRRWVNNPYVFNSCEWKEYKREWRRKK